MNGELYKRVLYDGRLALRSLSKQPLFFVVVLLTFALGLGASTALSHRLRQHREPGDGARDGA